MIWAQHVGSDGLADGHGNRRNVSEGFAADVVEVWEVVGIALGELGGVIARLGIE